VKQLPAVTAAEFSGTRPWLDIHPSKRDWVSGGQSHPLYFVGALHLT
jgi:hypothetical protein